MFSTERFYYLLCLSVTVYGQFNKSTLIFTQVWFRHGQRAPTTNVHFPFDKVLKEFPIEAGELTKNGKLMEFQLGRKFRETYENFIPSVHKPHQLRVFFDGANRTSTSAQLAMAGLFPPVGEDLWNEQLLWNPISLHEEPVMEHISFGIFDKCPNAKRDITRSQGYKDAFTNVNSSLVEQLRKLTQVPINDTRSLNDVADSLVTRYRMNDSRLPIPAWLDEKMHQTLSSLSNYLHTEMLRMTSHNTGAWHIDTILHFFDDHLVRDASKKNKGIFMSGHDTNIKMIRTLLTNCENYCPLPGYGGHVALELHQVDGQLYVKMYYSQNFSSPRQAEVISACGNPCAYEQFTAKLGKRRMTSSEWMTYCLGTDDSSNWRLPFFIALLALLLSFIANIVQCKWGNCKGRTRSLHDHDEYQPLLSDRT